MAEFIGDEGFLETIVDDTRRPANHKAQWTEAALRELEMLVMRKETVYRSVLPVGRDHQASRSRASPKCAAAIHQHTEGSLLSGGV